MINFIVLLCIAIGVRFLIIYLLDAKLRRNENILRGANTYAFDKEEVKLFVESAQEQGYTIHVKWTQIDGESETNIFLTKNGEVQELSKKNAKHLSGLKHFSLFVLYDHSKRYDIKGEGIIKFENQQVIFLYNMNRTLKSGWIGKWVEFNLEDKFGLISKNRHKAEIMFFYSYTIKESTKHQTKDRKLPYEQFSVLTYVAEGDEISIGEEEKTYYQSQFMEKRKQFIAENTEENNQFNVIKLTYTTDQDTIENPQLHILQEIEKTEHLQNQKAVIIG